MEFQDLLSYGQIKEVSNFLYRPLDVKMKKNVKRKHEMPISISGWTLSFQQKCPSKLLHISPVQISDRFPCFHELCFPLENLHYHFPFPKQCSCKPKGVQHHCFLSYFPYTSHSFDCRSTVWQGFGEHKEEETTNTSHATNLPRPSSPGPCLSAQSRPAGKPLLFHDIPVSLSRN